MAKKKKKRINNCTYWCLTGDDPWQNLANAIVATAAEDYRKALIWQDMDAVKELEKFFYSQYYSILTKVDPDVIVKTIKKSIKNMRRY